jgi:type IV pilus assembly protein PilF
MRRATALLVLAALAGGCANPPVAERTDSERQRLADLNVQMGVEYMREGNHEVALKKLKKALEYDSRSSTAHTTLGILYNRLGEAEQAERHYSQAVKLAPKEPGALNNYGQFLCARGRVEDGLKLFERALEDPLYRTPAVPWTNSGLCSLGAGDRDAAESYFRSALQVDAEFPIALLQMTKLKLENGEHLSARAYLQRYTAVAEPSAQTLWMGVQIERGLGDEDAASSYALVLKSKFPDSEEAHLLEQSEE